MYKWPNRCSQLRYRASAIHTTGTLAPVQDYSVIGSVENGLGIRLVQNQTSLESNSFGIRQVLNQIRLRLRWVGTRIKETKLQCKMMMGQN
jgi:hypothetical protein